MHRLLERSRADEGFTLVEVMVAMTILLIVLTLSGSLLVRVMKQHSYMVQETQAQETNNNGMELMTRLFRQAVFPKSGNSINSSIITTAAPTQVTFTSRFSGTANASADPSAQAINRYTFQVVGTNLKWGDAAQSSCSTTPCTYGTPTASRTIVYGVRNAAGSTVCPANTGDGAVFHYWYLDSTGALHAWSSSLNTLNQISVVQVDLWTQTQVGVQRPSCVLLSDFVRLRNFQ